MIRVETQWHGDVIRFIHADGRAIDHSAEIDYNGRDYYFLGGFYYDLEPSLIDHLFGG